MDMPGHYFIMGIINISLCGISMSAQLIIFIFYFKYTSPVTNFQAKLIVLLSLANFISALMSFCPSVYYIHTRKNIVETSYGLAYAFGFLRVFFEYIGFGLVTIVTYSLHTAINHNSCALLQQKLLFFFLIAGTFFFILIPLTFGVNAYGESDQINCWLLNHYARFIFFIVWFILICVNFFFIFKIIKGLNSRIYTYEQNFSRRLILIPIIMFVFYFFTCTRRLCNIYKLPNGEYYDPLSIVYLMFIFMPQIGFWNALVVGTIDEKVKKRLKEFFLCLPHHEEENNFEEEIKSPQPILEEVPVNRLESLDYPLKETINLGFNSQK